MYYIVRTDGGFMPLLIKPEYNELSYMKKLLENRKTMAFCKRIIPFEKSKWDDFFRNAVNADPLDKFCRFIFCRKCNDFTGLCGWKYNEHLSGYEAFFLIENSRRRCHYAHDSLSLLKEAASQLGIGTFYARIAEDNEPALSFCRDSGFERIGTDEGKALFRMNFSA